MATSKGARNDGVDVDLYVVVVSENVSQGLIENALSSLNYCQVCDRVWFVLTEQSERQVFERLSQYVSKELAFVARASAVAGWFPDRVSQWISARPITHADLEITPLNTLSKTKKGVLVYCTVCSRPKIPWGRAATEEQAATMCGTNCLGYFKPPLPGALWGGESEHEYGFPVNVLGTTEDSH